MERINANGINGNGSFQRKQTMPMDNNAIANDREQKWPADPKGFLARNDKRALARRVDFDADKLVRETGNQGGRAFYCKALYKLKGPRVFELWDIAKEQGKNPVKLFTYLLKKDGV